MGGHINVSRSSGDLKWSRWAAAIFWVILFWSIAYLAIQNHASAITLVVLVLLGPLLGWQLGYKHLFYLVGMTIPAKPAVLEEGHE